MGKGKEWILSQSFWMEYGPGGTLIFKIWPPKLGKNTVLLLKAIMFMTLGYGGPRKLIYSPLP